LHQQNIDTRPTRLLQLSNDDGQPMVKLVHTAGINVENLPYVTLSHCWGQTLQARLTTDLVDDHTLGISWKHLTSTFQDAIVISLKLGMYYIWIDALCIIQDDEEDWSREAVRTTGVYLNSYLNISADASCDGAGGLFRWRNPIACQSFIVPHWKGDSQRCASIFYTDRWFRDIQSSPLSKRAWTVQEMFLAPRVLHFAAEVVHWECMELCTTESLPTLFNIIPESDSIILKSSLRHDLPEQDKARVLYDAWYQLVIAYSSGTLTFTSDRIIAIAGLAGIFCRLLGLSEGDYLCGIWRPQLEHDLMWKRSGPCWASHHTRLSDLPSWSRLSMCAETWICSGWIWGQREDDDLTTAEVVHASTTPVQTAFRLVSSGKVALQVFLCQCTIHRKDYAHLDRDYMRRMIPPYSGEYNYGYSMDLDGSTLREEEHFEICTDDDGDQLVNKTVYLMLGRARDPECDKSVARIEGREP
jgi:hypothetical protein